MNNTHKSTLRKALVRIEEAHAETVEVHNDLTDHLFDNDQALDNTDRGDVLRSKIDMLLEIDIALGAIEREIKEVLS